MDRPVIFCHYGFSDYLEYTLNCAKFNNPAKDVILLGDECNQKIAERCGAMHFLINDYNYGEAINTFDSVYRLVQGRKHNNIKNGKDWVKFVFKRWFYVYNFVVANGITSFWHFDSDNMLLDPLQHHEQFFSSYDVTEQCNGNCMNGFISSPEVVYGYIQKINELFQRREFLQSYQKEYDEIHPEYAFTEMGAYVTFKNEEGLNSVRLNTIVNDSSFDDCICQKHGMQMETLPSGKKIKKVLLGPGGTFFCQRESDGSLIKMNSLNLSWVPLYIYHIVLRHSVKRSFFKDHKDFNIREAQTLVSRGMPVKYIVAGLKLSLIEKCRMVVKYCSDYTHRYN